MMQALGKVAGAHEGDLLLIVAGIGGMPAKEPGSPGA